MPNEENLIPMDQRSESEVRDLGQKGGKASGTARRRKRSLKEAADIYLSLPVSDKRRWNAIARKGVAPEDADNQMAMIIGLTEAATQGDAKAAELIVDLIGDVAGVDDAGCRSLTTYRLSEIILTAFAESHHSFGISIGIRDIDVHTRNTIQIILYAPDDTVAQDLGILNMEGTDSEDTLPKEFQGVILNADMRNVYLKMQGIYKIRELFNEKILSEHSLPVYEGAVRS